MKIQNIKDLKGFFDAVDRCKGAVELCTEEGERLNLKSKLSQYVSLAELFSDGYVKELELVVHNPDDAKLLLKYMVNK